MRVYTDKIKDPNVFATYKIDGVRGIKTRDSWLSRAGKPLYNLPDMPEGEYEIFLGDFKSSISACRTMSGPLINHENLYKLTPEVDRRLVIGYIDKDEVKEHFNTALILGYEGLVIYTSKGPYKIKNKLTFDVEVLRIQPGTGKYAGKMGALIVRLKSAEFKVGTGFTDIERETFNSDSIIGMIAEVEAMSLLPSGRLRHPRFMRLREDLR